MSQYQQIRLELFIKSSLKPGKILRWGPTVPSTFTPRVDSVTEDVVKQALGSFFYGTGTWRLENFAQVSDMHYSVIVEYLSSELPSLGVGVTPRWEDL